MIGVIDIGAHRFEEYEKWKSLGATNFLLFEPVKENYEYLIKNFYCPEVIIKKIALSDETGKRKMYVDSKHQYLSSSLLKPTAHYEDYPNVFFDSEEIVDVNLLDNIPYDRGLYDHIYMTAQGSDLQILRGAEESLKYIRTISAQVFSKRLYEGSFIIEEFTGFLSDRGFNLVELIRTGRSRFLANYSR